MVFRVVEAPDHVVWGLLLDGFLKGGGVILGILTLIGWCDFVSVSVFAFVWPIQLGMWVVATEYSCACLSSLWMSSVVLLYLVIISFLPTSVNLCIDEHILFCHSELLCCAVQRQKHGGSTIILR